MSEHGLEPTPLTRFYDLSDLGKAGAEIRIEAESEDLARLAAWLDVTEVSRFVAAVTLARRGTDRFGYDAELEADLVQPCVVTLEPVSSRHRLHVRRALHVLPRQRGRVAAEEGKVGVLTLAAGDDEAPEELESYRYDLAAPLLEELSLDLNPYPRASGVEFEAPAAPDDEKPNPFAVLKRLKGEG